jgi:Bifunctional DNA primase/polymerase, N-terminal
MTTNESPSVAAGAPESSGETGNNHNALTIPLITDDMDMLAAALAYADAGWYVLPVKRGTKKPGSVVGNGWQHQSSRDPKVITAWFAGTDHDIALHCGRSGAVVFDFDKPEKAPEALKRRRAAGMYQRTRPDTPGRGHVVFLQPPGRTIGNSGGRLGDAWGEVRGLNAVIIAQPSHHADGGEYEWACTGPVPALPDEIAELLDNASPAEDAASDAAVTAFLEQNQQATRPEVLCGLTKALADKIAAGASRHKSATSIVTGAMKEARCGYFAAKDALAALKPIFINAVMIGEKKRTEAQALSEWRGIVAWAVGQALAADLEEVKARTEQKMPNNVEWVSTLADHEKSGESTAGDGESTAGDDDDDETVRTVPWPTLNNAALHGIAGKIVNLVAPHTEADSAAVLVQLLAEFGATLGAEPHFVAGNDRHQAIINPLIVGRTNNGAKGTGLAVVEAIRKQALPWFDEFTASGLSSAEGLIEMVRDPSGEPDDNDYDPGVADKRLLIKESEYKSVLVRMRREGNTLGPTLRDTFDCRPLRTLTRKHNKLTATGAHIVVIGHVTPGEFRATLQDSDLSGGTVNRMLICLSRRSRLHSRLGNLPNDVLAAAGKLFEDAYKGAIQRGEMKFTDKFWGLWDAAYRELNRDRPDSRATEATARGVTMVLRLSLLYALIDGKDMIDVDHLDAALALWAYAEHSARWLFSSHELEVQRESAGGLANFILDGGSEGRTRTEISRDYFKRHKSAAEISAELAPLVHDGVVIEIKEETRGRTATRYTHRSCVKSESAKYAAHGTDSVANYCETSANYLDPAASGDEVNSHDFADSSQRETCHDLQSSHNSLIRSPEHTTDTNLEPPGGVTESTPGWTDRVQQIVASAAASPRSDHEPADVPRRPRCICVEQPEPCHFCLLENKRRDGAA